MPARAATFRCWTSARLADIPICARLAESKSVRVTTYSVDQAETLARLAARVLDGSTCGDARCLPFADASVDVVICSQVLHHFEDAELDVVLAELHRVARRAVIVSDLRRSWFAAAGFWLVTWPMGFHAVTRHDGATSVLRGFGSELPDVHPSTGRSAHVRQHLGYRPHTESTHDRPSASSSVQCLPRPEMKTVDERLIVAPLLRIFRLAADVERWPASFRITGSYASLREGATAAAWST